MKSSGPVSSSEVGKTSIAPSGSAGRAPRVLVTAGPTHEPIDAVRYIGNRSSGRMGIALAEACLGRAWPVTLLLGPVGISPPTHPHLTLLRFQTAAELQVLLHESWPKYDLLLMAAAVADYRVGEVGGLQKSEVRGQKSVGGSGKIKRGNDRLLLELVPTPDLVASLNAITRFDQVVVGFALEPQANLLAEAKRKMARKGLHAIVANPLKTMDAPDITARLLFADGHMVVAPENLAKERFAEWLLDQLGPAIKRAMSRG